MELLKTAKRPIVNHQKSYKQTQSAENNWIGWFSFNLKSLDLEEAFLNWLENKLDEINRNDPSFKQAIMAWRVRIQSFIPTFPCHSIFLCYEKDQVGMFPMPYRLKMEGIYTATIGWPKLWGEMIYEPPIRIIEITTDQYKLYEIIDEHPVLQIQIQFESDDKFAVLNDFITSVGIINRVESGPMVVICSPKINTDLKCLILANNVSVQSYWHRDENTSLNDWWRSMAKNEVTVNWKEKWVEDIINDADTSGMLIDSLESLNKTLNMNRIQYIILPNDYDHADVLYKFSKAIIMNKIRLIATNKPYLHGIKYQF